MNDFQKERLTVTDPKSDRNSNVVESETQQVANPVKKKKLNCPEQNHSLRSSTDAITGLLMSLWLCLAS